jgi:hypothetical protein
MHYRTAGLISGVGCVIALGLTGVGCYCFVSNQNNDNYQNQQADQSWQNPGFAQPFAQNVQPQCITFSDPGWLYSLSSVNGAPDSRTGIQFKWAQSCAQSDGSYTAGVEAPSGVMVDYYSQTGFTASISKLGK